MDVENQKHRSFDEVPAEELAGKLIHGCFIYLWQSVFVPFALVIGLVLAIFWVQEQLSGEDEGQKLTPEEAGALVGAAERALKELGVREE